MSARRDAIFALALWRIQGTFPAMTLRESTHHADALELVGAVLRRKSSLEWILKQCVKRMPSGELWAALMVGAAQLLVMPGMAEHAAIAETVEAAKPIGRDAAKFVNAVLRRIQREKAPLLTALAAQPEHLQRDIPRALWTRWCDAFGLEQTRAIAEALATAPQVCVRPLPPHPAPAECTPHPDDECGTFIVPRHTRITDLTGYAEGAFVVQDAATRHAVELMNVAPGMAVLDACAAPGGKTAQLAARLGATDQLIANEYSATRLDTLRDTLTRCGLSERVTVRQADATTTHFGYFDRILLDVPCSNTGVFGRRPDARWTWTQQKLTQLLQTQRALLDNLAPQVKPGGRLIYSTCSIEPEENEAQIDAFLARHPDFTRGELRRDFPTPTHDGAFACSLNRLLARR